MTKLSANWRSAKSLTTSPSSRMATQPQEVYIATSGKIASAEDEASKAEKWSEEKPGKNKDIKGTLRQNGSGKRRQVGALPTTENLRIQNSSVRVTDIQIHFHGADPLS
jgi:hypothetical protein